MKIRKTLGERVFDGANIAFMLIVSAVTLLPIVHVIFVSISSGPETLKGGLFLYPKGFSLKGYEVILKDSLWLRSYMNTIIYAVSHTALTLLLTAMTAYPLSIPEFKLKKFVTIYLTITMFISGGMIPTYMLMRNLGIVNTMWVLIVPFCVGAYNVILFRTFFQGIPPSLREAAIIDGASEFVVLTRIIIPLSKAIFATIGLFSIVSKWNEWFPALIYINQDKLYPLQMILRKILFNSVSMEHTDAISAALFRTNEVTSQNIKMASIMVVILPIACIYPFLQKYFAKGILIGTIKG